jgi:hypothetical protein
MTSWTRSSKKFEAGAIHMHELIAELEGAVIQRQTTMVCELGRELLRQLAQDPDRCVAMRHPVGFVHVALPQLSGHTARLHIWPSPNSEPQHPDWRVHSHQWHLRSYVLVGRVVNVEHQVEVDAAGANRLYEVLYIEGTSVLRSTDRRVICRRGAESTEDAGSTYEVARGCFHTTYSPGRCGLRRWRSRGPHRSPGRWSSAMWQATGNIDSFGTPCPRRISPSFSGP